METVKVNLPDETYRLLKEKALKQKKSTEKVLLEILEESLKPTVKAKTTQQQTVAQILEKAGRLRKLSPYLHKKIITSVNLKSIQAALSTKSGKSLSEIIIEQRGNMCK